MMHAERKLEEMCLRGFLRYLGGGPRTTYGGSLASLVLADLEALRMWWALSEPVGALAARCISRPREIAPAFDDFRRETFGEISGSLDAAASALLQAATNDPCAFVVTESTGTWVSGPNRVLVKTLDSARGALRSAALHARGGLFDGPARERLAVIDEALRVEPLRELLALPDGRAQVTAHERRQIAKVRAPLYRLAWDCTSVAYAIENLDAEPIADLLQSEVLPRLETWRQFELVCLLEISAALASASGYPCMLDASFTSSRPAAQIGDLEVWWQRSIRSRPDEHLDDGESMAVDLAASLNVTAGTPRADLTIERAGRVLGVVECKWFREESSAPGAILEASSQIVRYARDVSYMQGEPAETILSRSLVALASRGPAPLRIADGPIGCFGFDDLGVPTLQRWATSILLA